MSARFHVFWSAALAVGGFLVATTSTTAANYHIDAVTGSDSNDGSLSSPWKSADRVGMTDLQPGDAVYFRRGQTWTGGFAVDSDGTPQAPILISAYGTGAAPILTNPDNQDFNGNCVRIRGDHVTVEKLHFDATSDARGGASVFDIGAVYIADGADYATIQDCTFSDCPKGINIYGAHATVTRNQFLNKGRSMQDRAWGPLAICIQSGHHEISYNTFLNHIGPSAAYTWDGGVIEVDVHTKSADGVWIHHNTSIGNCGFIENEFWELGGRTRDWIIAYNVIDDYQWFIDLGPGGNSIIAHNTVSIREKDPKCPYHFLLDGHFMRRSGKYYNNIFISWGGADLKAVPAELRRNNIFISVDGKTEFPGGPEMGTGERIVDPKFVDEMAHEFHLQLGSPAIDGGTDIGLTHELFKHDREGNPVPSGDARDVGAFEFQHVGEHRQGAF